MLNPTSPYFKISLLAALLTTALMCSLKLPAQQPSAPLPLPEKPAPKKRKPAEMFGLVREEMPLFPGCGEGLKYPEHKKCADSLLVAFIYENLRYPYQAWQDSVEGMAVVSFTVEKDGSVADVRAVRDPGAGTGAEAVRLVNLMQEQGLRWTPGTQVGKPVRVQFNLPVKFKMGDHDYLPPPLPIVNCTDIFMVVDEMPRFPGCEDIDDELERKRCSDQKLIQYLLANVELTPLQVESCGVQGTNIIQFVIEKDGTISNAKIIRDIGVGYGQSALKAVESMNKNNICWTPGRQSGRPVRVQYNVPVRIKWE